MCVRTAIIIMKKQFIRLIIQVIAQNEGFSNLLTTRGLNFFLLGIVVFGAGSPRFGEEFPSLVSVIGFSLHILVVIYHTIKKLLHSLVVYCSSESVICVLVKN